MSRFELNLVFYALTLYFQGFMSETFDFEKSEQKYFMRNLCRPRLPGICSTLKNLQDPNSRTSLRLKLEMQMPDLAPQEVNSNLLFLSPCYLSFNSLSPHELFALQFTPCHLRFHHACANAPKLLSGFGEGSNLARRFFVTSVSLATRFIMPLITFLAAFSPFFAFFPLSLFLTRALRKIAFRLLLLSKSQLFVFPQENTHLQMTTENPFTPDYRSCSYVAPWGDE